MTDKLVITHFDGSIHSVIPLKAWRQRCRCECKTDGMRELLDISHDEYRDIYGQMQELISKSEELLYVLERDKDVSEKKWWLDQRAQLAEAIDNAKKC